MFLTAKTAIIAFLTLFLVKGVWAQAIDSCLVRQLIEKNERVLGLTDKSLVRETKHIRLFNLTDTKFDQNLLWAVNPMTGNHSVFYKSGFSIDLVQSKSITPDINTGRYRDIFIVNFKIEPDKTVSIATLAFVFKPSDGLNQNKILGQFEFAQAATCFELKRFSLGGVD